MSRLTVRYPHAPEPAVDRVSFTVPRGQVHGFIGPNGAGKTTTLRVLAALLAPSSGTAKICGLDVAEKPDEVRRRIGYLPDAFGAPEGLSCAEYLELHAVLQGIPRHRREAAVADSLAITELEALADASADSLSRGLLQRLGLARVLLHEPEVLLLDEPASGLDPRARVEVRELLRELGRLGKAVLVSSHVLADLAAACDAVSIMERGRLLHSDSLEETLRRAAALVEPAILVLAAEGRQATRDALEADAGLAARVEDGENELLRVVLDAACEGPVRVGRALVAAGLTPVHLELEDLDLEQAFLALSRGRLA